MTKKLDLTRIYKEDSEKLKKMVLKVSSVQGEKVTNPELIRRILNHPNIENVLLSDAEIKRRLRNV